MTAYTRERLESMAFNKQLVIYLELVDSMFTFMGNTHYNRGMMVDSILESQHRKVISDANAVVIQSMNRHLETHDV